MKWRRRRRDSQRSGSGGSRDRAATKDDLHHLQTWAEQRRGVEAFVEPQTTVSETTVLLVAHDGEWTRRRVASPQAAKQWAEKLTIPLLFFLIY